MIEIAEARKRLVFPLDVSDRGQMREWIDLLREDVGVFKVGLELFTAVGPDAVRAVIDAGVTCFLDLKLHDIPATMAGATASALRLGASYLTVHASAGSAALREVAAIAPATGPLRLLAVTVLTSLDERDLSEIGLAGGASESAARLADIAQEAGVRGVVCSALEVGALRARVSADTVLVVPGVRPSGAALGDQRRVATPARAIVEGADLLVVGRPIREAADPRGAARAIVAEIAAAARA